MCAWKMGDFIRPTAEASRWDKRAVTEGALYVVNGVRIDGGTAYLRILGDDNLAHEYIDTMFEKATPRKCPCCGTYL